MTPTAAVASPCISVCCMDTATGWCTGCQRTIDEIAAWSGLGDDDKRAVWALIEARRLRLPTQSAAPLAAERGSARV